MDGAIVSLLLGVGGGLLVGWGLGRIRHGHPDGWGFAFLGVVLVAIGVTHGVWGT